VDAVVIIIAIVASVAALMLIQYNWPQPRVVREHERGIIYRKGHLVREVQAGRYWLRPRIDELLVIDARRRQAVIAGQEVLTSDRVPIKVSLIAEFSVVDARKAVSEVDRYQDVLYANIQLALRQAIAERELEAALAERGEIGQAIVLSVQSAAANIGVVLHSVGVRDFMMAGGLRSAFADVIEARQKGLAALERARGESAAVRNLANAAQLMEKHPDIMQLRLLQAVEIGSGNRIVIALDPERGRSKDAEIVTEGDV
jgi:regulator of protease activity HflC (stomatin/prohibitin superfamily)